MAPDVHCSHRPPCPGCPALGQPMASLPIIERLTRLAARSGAVFSLAPPAQPLGYRHRVRLAVRGRAGSPKLGIFQTGSHRIADIPNCLVQHPRINEVAAAVKAAIRESGLAPYADGPHRGLIRYIQVMLDGAAERVQLVVVTNAEQPDSAAALWQLLTARLGTSLQGLFWNGQPARDNAILGPHWEKITGHSALDEVICGAHVFFPPDAFAQNNPAVYRQIVDRIGTWVPDGTDLVEFYAGVGTIGLSLLPRARSVCFNELGKGSLRGLSLGLLALAPDLAQRARVVAGRAGQHADLVTEASTVIVDPPRKGLDPELLEALCAPTTKQRELIYLSCGPEALLTEAERLHATHPLRELVVHDLFPWTGHVEVLARFATEAA